MKIHQQWLKHMVITQKEHPHSCLRFVLTASNFTIFPSNINNVYQELGFVSEMAICPVCPASFYEFPQVSARGYMSKENKFDGTLSSGWDIQCVGTRLFAVKASWFFQMFDG